MKARFLIQTLVVLLCGCQMYPSARLETARNLAQESGMAEHDIMANPFLLRSYERIRNPSAGTVRVYIEGDGLAWLSRREPSLDPTPLHPVALSLARQDDGANVVYLARPCQYNHAYEGGGVCPDRYWLSDRFAPEVITSMNAALDDLKARYGLQRFELVGFSGGAAVALLLAARRDDIASIRTVAGNLDTEAFNSFHDVSAMPGSLNPASFMAQTSHIPQVHFVGAEDRIVPPALYENFRRTFDSSPCIREELVPDAAHNDGWADRWPAFLRQEPSCGDTQPRRADDGLSRAFRDDGQKALLVEAERP